MMAPSRLPGVPDPEAPGRLLDLPREAAEFVNLYSKSRGINRFPALVETLEWLQKRPDVKARNVHPKVPASLAKWVKEETKLGNPALQAKVEAEGDADLKHALD